MKFISSEADNTASVSALKQSVAVRRSHALLHHSSHFRNSHRRITITEVDGALILRGSLPSYYLKQVLQEMLRPMGLRILNRVVVEF